MFTFLPLRLIYFLMILHMDLEIILICLDAIYYTLQQPWWCEFFPSLSRDPHHGNLWETESWAWVGGSWSGVATKCNKIKIVYDTTEALQKMIIFNFIRASPLMIYYQLFLIIVNINYWWHNFFVVNKSLSAMLGKHRNWYVLATLWNSRNWYACKS